MSAATITLLFLLFAVVMFVFEKIPLGVTSMIVCIGLVVTGVLDIKTAFAGFIDSNVILFVAMFIVGGALFETGMANKIGGIVTHFAKSERSLIVAIMVIVGLMSGFLSNTGTAAVLIPVVIGIAAKSGYARSKLLMPLVFAAAMGGNLSLIGAPAHFMTMVKQQGALLAKGRLLGIQFDVLFTDGLYFSISKNAIATANRLKKGFAEKGYRFFMDSPTNQIFLVLENAQLAALEGKAKFGFWEKFDDTHTVVRIATSWATRMEEIEQLIDLM